MSKPSPFMTVFTCNFGTSKYYKQIALLITNRLRKCYVVSDEKQSFSIHDLFEDAVDELIQVLDHEDYEKQKRLFRLYYPKDFDACMVVVHDVRMAVSDLNVEITI